jgi:protein tyrosine/serine phosphatase
MTELIAGFLIACVGFVAGWLHSSRHYAKTIESNKVLRKRNAYLEHSNAAYYGSKAKALTRKPLEEAV